LTILVELSISLPSNSTQLNLFDTLLVDKSYLIKLDKGEVSLFIPGLRRASSTNIRIKGSGLIKSLTSIYKLS
jgi:hypothetical protein